MSRYIVFITALLLSCSLHAATTDELWDRGNAAYIRGDYHASANHYDSIATQGSESYKLYYNMGNAYFKANKIGKAMLNYNRAMRLRPTDADIKYNIAVANQYVKDKIEPVPQFFLITWISNLRKSLSSNAWATMSLIALLIGFAGSALYLLSGRLSLRKTGFFISLFMAAMFFVSSVFAAKGRNEIINSSEAIVMRSAVPVKSAPNATGKDIFVLHEGTKVSVISTLDNWCEISVADGNKGWIEQSSIETI